MGRHAVGPRQDGGEAALAPPLQPSTAKPQVGTQDPDNLPAVGAWQGGGAVFLLRGSRSPPKLCS